MRKAGMLAVLFCASIAAIGQPPIFDWIKASDQNAQLDPVDFHAGRAYRPGADGGNLHVDIQSTLPVTIAMATADAWNDPSSTQKRWPT